MKPLNKTVFSGDEVSHIYFTSDSHFGHENIIKICNRPYESTFEMNTDLINKWNSVVGPDDYVFHLGDIIFGGSSVWKDILEQLNGKIVLILGNHDHKNFRNHYEKYFEAVVNQAQITIDGQSVLLNHYPFLCYGGTYRKNPVYQIHGHIHFRENGTGADDIRCAFRFPYQYDVGVDGNNYTPLSWYKVSEIIDNQIKESNNFFYKIKNLINVTKCIFK